MLSKCNFHRYIKGSTMYKGPYLANCGSGSCVQKGRRASDRRSFWLFPFLTPEHLSHNPRWWQHCYRRKCLFCIPYAFFKQQFSTDASSLFHTPRKSAVKRSLLCPSVLSYIIITFAQLFLYWNLLIWHD